jgi:branched-subunit amino acid transport protein
MTTWAVILAVGMGSFLLRVAPLLLLQNTTLSDRADHTVRYAGLAAIAGLIATSVQHAAHGSSSVPTLLAVAAGTSLAVRGRSMVRIIAVGGAIYAGASVVFGLLGR